MARGSYGLQRILTLANGTTPGMLSAALWSKLSAMLGINTLTLPLRLTGSTASIDAATGSAPGSMSATDKAKLDAATNTNSPSTLVQRDASGNFSAGTITAALAGNASTATSATSATSATTAAACSGNAATATALQGGGTDRTKLDNVGTFASAVLGGDVTLSVGGWTSILTITLAPGRWLVNATILFGDALAAGDFAAYIEVVAGPPVTLSPRNSGQVTTQGAGKLAPVTLNGLIDCGSYSPQVRLYALANSPSANAKVKASPSIAALDSATILTAVRVS